MRCLWLTFRKFFSVDHSIAAFGEAVRQKKAKPILIEKNCLQRGPRGNSLNKEVSEDQANFKSGSSDQATSKLSITFLLTLFQT